jgi:hypothetical protein
MADNPNYFPYSHNGKVEYLEKSNMTICGLAGISPTGTTYKECPLAERRDPARIATFDWKAKVPGTSGPMIHGSTSSSPCLAALRRKQWFYENNKPY